MHQGRGVERLTRLFVSKFLGCYFAELVIDKRQELRRRLWFAAVQRFEDMAQVAHVGEDT
jgi:hypothetical protein